MEFTEIRHRPQFTLTMSLEEAIQLWKIVDFAYEHGCGGANIFIDALTEFASDSNSYNEFL